MSLLQMPDIVLSLILLKSDFRSILVLRKVCRDLRNFIDDQKPESNLDDVSISINSETLEMDIPFKVIGVKYQKSDYGTLISGKSGYDEQENFVEGICFFDLFLKDFKVILMNQKKPINFLSLYFNIDNPNMLKKLREFWDHPIPIKRLSIRTKSQEEVMSFLPNVDLKSFESMQMFSSKSMDMEIDEIVRTPHWRILKNVEIKKLITSAGFSHFSHLERVMIDREYVMGPDVAEVKKIFLTSPNMKWFMICTKYVNKPQYDAILGESIREQDRLGRTMTKWTCKVPNCDQEIQFALYGGYEEWIVDVKRVAVGN